MFHLKRLPIILSCLLSFAFCAELHSTEHMLHVFKDTQLSAAFDGFLTEVLRQVPSQEFYELITSLLNEENPTTDIQLYEKLLQKIDSIKYHPSLFYKLKSLAHQKEVLTDQMQQLLVDQKRIEGTLEIGTPGIYTSCVQSFLPIIGPKYVINDTQKATDRFQSFSLNPFNKFLPYNHFVPLNDYAPIKESDIPSNSIDLVICMIGLHHVPHQKLYEFIASINRILRPGGTFLLRDHDCLNSDLESIIYTAHSVFNAIVTSDSVQQEAEEYRNFQPLSFWIEALKQQGFEANPTHLQQQGDPTHNTMLTFKKVAQNTQEKIIEISHSLTAKPGYQRDLCEGYLSAPEWFNVDAAQHYGKFINRVPFYEFPYLEYVKTYWNVFAKSWQAAAKKKGNWSVSTSPATLINLFVGVTMTAEYAAKSIISLPIRLMYSGQAPTNTKVLLHDPKNEIDSYKGITVVERYPEVSLKLVSMPRYKEFLRTITMLTSSEITIHEIAGQKEIPLKVRYPKIQQIDWSACKDITVEYPWQVSTQDYTYACLTVPVNKLLPTLAYLKNQKIEVVYIHEF